MLIAVGQSKHIHKVWGYLLFKSDYIYFEQNRVLASMVFIRSPEKLEIYFSGRGISSSPPVHFSPVFYAVEILFSLKHLWNMSGKNICESCDHDYADTPDNSFYYLILSIVEVANQPVPIFKKKYFSGNVLGER